MKKLLNISCKKATYLVSKKEVGEITFWDSIKLKIHLNICSACRLFEKQSWFIKLNLANKHEDQLDIFLSKQAKEKIDIALKNEF